MKPFNLEAAKNGRELVTGNGIEAHFIAHVPEAKKVIYRIGVSIFLIDEEGKVFLDKTSPNDLYMVTKKRTVWVNFYDQSSTGYFYETEQEADYNQGRSEEYKRLGGKAYPVEIEE